MSECDGAEHGTDVLELLGVESDAINDKHKEHNDTHECLQVENSDEGCTHDAIKFGKCAFAEPAREVEKHGDDSNGQNEPACVRVSIEENIHD